MPKISVVIPVYNAGTRLTACLDSIQKQTLRDIEIICVLDCPTDGSDMIVKNFAQTDSRFIVLENANNINTGMSRNRGLSIATGEYIAFCDHDDILEPTMYEDLYEVALQNDSDIVLGVPEYTYPDSSMNKSYFYPEESDVRQKLLSCIIGKTKSCTKDWDFFYNHGMIWDNIYRKRMLDENNIKFIDNNKVTFEDNLFLIQSLNAANRAYVFNNVVYHHTIESTNTASTPAYTKTEKILAYIDYLYRYLQERNIFVKYTENFNNAVAHYTISCLSSEIKKLIRGDKSSYYSIKKIKGNIHSRQALIAADPNVYLNENRSFLKRIYHTLLINYIVNNYV